MADRRAFLLGLAGLMAAAHARADAALRLPSPPHPPGDAPDLMVHVPALLDAARLVHAAVFLHGFSCCARALVSELPVSCYTHGPRGKAYGLARLHDASHAHALLVVPQLAMLARDARAPRFQARGGFDAVLDAAYRAAARELGRAPMRGRVLLVAHSAGYRAAADILADPARKSAVHAVLLLDALYARADTFARFVAQGAERTLVSLHTGEARTRAQNERLLTQLGLRAERVGYEQLTARLRPGRAFVSRVATPHGALPARHYTELVAALLA